MIAGDSAGGHLSVDLLLQPDVRHPAALVLLSPLVDLTFGLARTREQTRPDPAMRSRHAARLVELYCAEIESTHPRLSLDVVGGRAAAADADPGGRRRDARRRRDRARRRSARRRRPTANCRSGPTRCTCSRHCHDSHPRRRPQCAGSRRSSRTRCATATSNRRAESMGIFGFGTKRSHDADAVITGAGSGIGAAFATELARRGGRVVCSDIDEGAARATADAIVADGGTRTGAALRRHRRRRRASARRGGAVLVRRPTDAGDQQRRRRRGRHP